MASASTAAAAEGSRDSSRRLADIEKLCGIVKYSWAEKLVLIDDEALRLDVDEMQRHLSEPNFSGEPEKVRLFFSWFVASFSSLLKIYLQQHHRLMTRLSFRSQDIPSSLMEASARIMPAVADVSAVRVALEAAEMDDRPNVAETLRSRVQELAAEIRQLLQQRRDFLPTHLEQHFSEEEASRVFDALEEDLPLTSTAARLPWQMHAVSRWADQKFLEERRNRLPWQTLMLLDFVWSPFFLNTNWGTLQSMADVVDEEDND